MEANGQSMASILETNRPYTNSRRKRRDVEEGEDETTAADALADESSEARLEEMAVAARQTKQQAAWRAKRQDDKARRKEQKATRRAEAKARKLAPKIQRRAEKMAKAQRRAEAALKRAAKAQQPTLSKETIEDSDVEAES